MPQWNYTLRLGDVFHGDLTFERKRDIIVERIRTSRFWGEEYSFNLADIVGMLEATPTVSDFDSVWQEFYDWADENRVWVETF